MPLRYRNWVIFGFVVALLLPFVLITDLFPFFRFGMFAEPVKRSVQTEQFAVQWQDRQGRLHGYDPAEHNLNGFNYLTRNYFYRNQGPVLLQRLHGLHAHPDSVAQWQLIRTRSLQPTAPPTDTAVVARFTPTSR